MVVTYAQGAYVQGLFNTCTGMFQNRWMSDYRVFMHYTP